MDIHRCRFVPYPPQAINALAFSRPSDTQRPCPPEQRLAIGRANGDIEIWNPAKGRWFQESIFRGGKDRSIEGLAWTRDLGDEGDEVVEGERAAGRLRLFSIGFSSTVTEWDLARGVPLRHANGNFGTIWCLAAQPRWAPHRHDERQHGSSHAGVRHDQYLAAGCEDGTIVLFSTDDGDLRYLKTMVRPPTKKPRALTITWKDGNTIVAGFSDSNIRVYDIRNRQTVRNMSLGKSALGGNETLVWAVKCLPNGNILSGDSAGDLKIWDGNNYSLVQRLHCHEADVLDIATNTKGSMIITGGADRRTVMYKITSSGKGDRHCRWTQVMHRRFHEHDVKVLAALESQDLSVAVSGGLDTAPVVMPLRGWQKEYHRKLPHLPRSPQTSSARRARLFISWWDRLVSIWYLSRHGQQSEVSEGSATYPENHILLAQVVLQGEENITSARISEDGKYLAVATVSNTKIFRLRLQHRPNDGRMCLRTKKLKTLTSIERVGARLVSFSPNSRWLCLIRLSNEIVLVRIESGSDSKASFEFSKHTVKLNRSVLQTGTDPESAVLGDYLNAINNISFSADSRLLAVGDLSGRIATWVLEGREQSSNGHIEGIERKRGPDLSRSPRESSSDDDSSDEEDDAARIYGQRWRKNPAGAYLPKLDAPLLTLSFRPGTSGGKKTAAKDDVGSHPTRLTPHPHAHDLPTGEDRLVAVTAEHQVVEFHVLQGMLSIWSRRNPASYLPGQFRQIRERAMGCFWDVSNIHERLWLYGPTWMFMLDLAQDLPSAESTKQASTHDMQPTPQTSKQKKKRKREEYEAEKLRGRGSGAGGNVVPSESHAGIEGHLRNFKGSKHHHSQPIPLEEEPPSASEQDEELGLGSGALAQHRREAEQRSGPQPLVNGYTRPHANGTSNHVQEASQGGLFADEKSNGPATFLSLKYRSILGIVPIGGAWDEELERAGEEKHQVAALEGGPEIAIIERPLWDVDLPPRFDGGQDWET